MKQGTDMDLTLVLCNTDKEIYSEVFKLWIQVNESGKFVEFSQNQVYKSDFV